MEFTFYLSGAIAVAATLMVIVGLSAVHAEQAMVVARTRRSRVGP